MGAQRIERVEDMSVYRLFYTLALEVENTSRKYGTEFRWLRNQCLRASESVCANMTEGFNSQYSTEYLQSLYRCRREACETMTHIKYAKDVSVLPTAIADDLIIRYEEALCQLTNLISSIERKIELVGKSKPAFHAVREEQADYDINHEPLTINHQPLTINH